MPATADLLLAVRPNPLDPLIAVAQIPDGVTIDAESVLADASGRAYRYARGRDFERLAGTAPFSRGGSSRSAKSSTSSRPTRRCYTSRSRQARRLLPPAYSADFWKATVVL